MLEVSAAPREMTKMTTNQCSESMCISHLCALNYHTLKKENKLFWFLFKNGKFNILSNLFEHRLCDWGMKIYCITGMTQMCYLKAGETVYGHSLCGELNKRREGLCPTSATSNQPPCVLHRALIRKNRKLSGAISLWISRSHSPTLSVAELM